jgi:peptidyl-prolyl cis-trans isomerase SurA
MRDTVKTVFPALLALTLVSPQARAQTSAEPELLGSIVAVVGDSVITNFDMAEAVRSWEARTRGQLPTDPAGQNEVLRELLRDRIDQLLLVQAAVRDTTIRIDDGQIDAAVEQRLQQLRTQFGGDAGLTRALRESNITLQGFRASELARQRREALVDAYLAQITQLRKPPPVTDAEVLEFFEENRALVGERPASIVFTQIVLPVTPADSALEAARVIADSVMARARAGEDFAALAKQYSDDPGNRDLGGDLGWFRPGDLVPAFERAAFLLRPGAVSAPVLTQYGWHVIKLERIRGPERQARHILIRPEIDAADIERGRQLADSLGQEVRNGADIAELARRYGSSEAPVRVGPLVRDSLEAPLDSALANVNEGDVVGPLGLDLEGRSPHWVVARVVDLEEAREATVDDYRLQIQQRLARDKLVAEILDELRRRTYIEIREAALAGTG